MGYVNASVNVQVVHCDGPFLAVIVTPNPCPRHVCLMSVTKKIHVTFLVIWLRIAEELNSDGSGEKYSQ